MAKSVTSPAYLWYPKDALSSGRIAEMSAQEECWYRRALDHSWLDEGIPSDPAKCARRIGKNCTAKAAAVLLKMFFLPHKKDPTKMVNKRQEQERKKISEKFQKKSNAGKVSGRKRREIRDLNAEQRLNKTRTKTNIPIAIPNSSFKELSEAESSKENQTPPLLEIHLGKILTGVMTELGLKTERGMGNRQKWIEAGTVAFENDFTPEQFTECFAALRKKHSYAILPQYVIDRLPDFVKKQKPSERLPTAAEKLADAAANNAAMKPPPKPKNVEGVQ